MLNMMQNEAIANMDQIVVQNVSFVYFRGFGKKDDSDNVRLTIGAVYDQWVSGWLCVASASRSLIRQ